MGSYENRNMQISSASMNPCPFPNAFLVCWSRAFETDHLAILSLVRHLVIQSVLLSIRLNLRGIFSFTRHPPDSFGMVGKRGSKWSNAASCGPFWRCTLSLAQSPKAEFARVPKALAPRARVTRFPRR